MLGLEKRTYKPNNEPNFEFYVLNYDINARKLVMFNIFNNIHVYDNALAATKRHLRNKKKFTREDFEKELASIIKWQEWSRVEYEICAGEPFPKDESKLQKVDCWMQAEHNVPIIADMCILRYRQFLKEQKNKEIEETE